MCEEETGWEEEFEECVESFCDPPEPLANGTIPEIESSNMTVYPFNFELTYICNKGFRLIGDSWRFCDTRGWSGKSPTCEAIHCPDPGVPEHGTRIGNSFEIGDKVTFKCFTNYELIGSFERYCMPNGQWNNELARCDHSSNYCPDPGIPINGGRNSSSYEMGDIVGFSCYGGHILIGSEVRECLPNRKWSGEEAKCLGPYDFDNSAKIGDILKEAIAEKEAEQKRKLQEYHKALMETWHNGTRVMPIGRVLDINFPGRLIFYFAFDVSGSVKEGNFRKSVEFAKAITKKVGISKNGARVGALTFSSNAETQFLPLQYETTEDVLAAFDRLNFTGGGTAANTALTHIRQELIPLTQKWLSKKGMKSIIFILTDGKANMGGDPKEEAELLKQAGVEIYCIGVTNSVLQDSLYKIASDPKEEHVFILQNYATLAFLIEEITNGTVDYSKCGLGLEKLAGRGRIVGGGQATDPWPWMAALYFVGPGLQPEFQCGGSIIHESFILTAAHCLFKKNMKREEKDIIVKLGLTDVKNQSSLQEFEVKKIIVHPGYRNGKIFDYDIALLQLKRPMEYNDLIRPICLPPRELPLDTSLYKPGESVIAIGWGHTGIVNVMEHVDIQPVDQLKEIVLPIQPEERCRRVVLDRNLPENAFTERMFCAGDGRGKNDTCQGDSGGPLMQSGLNEDGYTYYTQVGMSVGV
ncbi:Complement factor B like protein [Argiope bruennichi]|uniref:C3/C5 convertase n=1 Tax=Argiope bruennichi TaxID=94029 RepID=A0A8T0E6V3_ARGBR|nr:Complement factor B like protein [Argiope bruennichi]